MNLPDIASSSARSVVFAMGPAGRLVAAVPGMIVGQSHMMGAHPAAHFTPSGSAPAPTDDASTAPSNSNREAHTDLLAQLGGITTGVLVGLYLTLRCR